MAVLRSEKKKIIEKVMEKETYKVKNNKNSEGDD